MSVRYQGQVDKVLLLNASQDFLSQISLESQSSGALRARNQRLRRSVSEQPADADATFPWNYNESKLHRFSSYPLEETNKHIRFTKDIRREQCSSRFLFVTRSTTIVSVFSVLPYQNLDTKRKALPFEREDNRQTFAQTISYGELLDSAEAPVETYDPFWLENPERSTNNYKTDIILPGIVVSFLEYENPESFKKGENEQFREKWPEVDITLSKMKSIKRDLLKVSESCHLPTMVLCYSYCYFETLAFSSYINKSNRKLAAGACLMLSKKFLFCNIGVLSELTEILRVSSRDIIAEEFQVLAALQFSLHYPESAVQTHYKRLMGRTKL